MIYDSKQTLVTCHSDHRRALTNYVFLDSCLREDANLIEVGQSTTPPASHCETLDAFPVFELEVPDFVASPLVEWPELDVGALSPLGGLILAIIHLLVFVNICLRLSVCNQQAVVVDGGHRRAESIG